MPARRRNPCKSCRLCRHGHESPRHGNPVNTVPSPDDSVLVRGEPADLVDQFPLDPRNVGLKGRPVIVAQGIHGSLNLVGVVIDGLLPVNLAEFVVVLPNIFGARYKGFFPSDSDRSSRLRNPAEKGCHSSPGRSSPVHSSSRGYRSGHRLVPAPEGPSVGL